MHSRANQVDDGQRSDREESVVLEIRRGDERAFADLYSTWFEPLWRFAYKYVLSRDLAEEIVQDVFLNIWSARSKFHVNSTVRAYLFGAVRNHALKLLQHDIVAQRFAEEGGGHLHPYQAPQPDIASETAELDSCVRETINALPERQKAAITLRVINGLGYAEIATLLGISVAAVGKLIEKSQNKIRKNCLGG